MADSKDFKSLAQFVSVEEKTWGELTKIVIRYTSPNYQDPKKEFTVGINVNAVDDALMDRITGLSIGDKFCLTTKKSDENPKFNDLVDVGPASDAPTKSKSDWKGKGGFVRDETGIAVGAAWTNAFDWYKVSEVVPKTLEEVAGVAQKILDAKLGMEALLRAKKASTQPKEETKEAKPLSKLEQAKLKKEQEAAKAKEAPKEEPKSEPTQDAQADNADLEDDIPF